MPIITIPKSEVNYVTLKSEHEAESLLSIDETLISDFYKKYGAILFRGFAVDVDTFGSLSARYCTRATINNSPGRDVVDTARSIQTVNLEPNPFRCTLSYLANPISPTSVFFAA